MKSYAVLYLSSPCRHHHLVCMAAPHIALGEMAQGLQIHSCGQKRGENTILPLSHFRLQLTIFLLPFFLSFSLSFFLSFFLSSSQLLVLSKKDKSTDGLLSHIAQKLCMSRCSFGGNFLLRLGRNAKLKDFESGFPGWQRCSDVFW